MASALEHLVSEVTSLISQRKFADAAKQLQKSREILQKNTGHLDTVLATLQPGPCTIAVAAVLRARLACATPSDANIDTLHATVAEFVAVCHLDQLAHAQDAMCEMLEEYCRLLVTGGCAMRGILVINSAISKLQSCTSPRHLTGAHPLLLQLCLASQCLKPAVAVLDTRHMDVSKEAEGFSVRHFLMYQYYGGMVYTAVKRYDRAYNCFKVCISTPALAVSHIMMEAYKKYIIVSLLIDGKVGKLPKCASMVVPRFIKPLCQIYCDLIQAYQTGPDTLAQYINQNAAFFSREGNYGLVKQLVVSQYKPSIQKLTRTFLTLSLADVALRVQLQLPKLAQQYLLNMIEDGEIYASINQRDGMVVFQDNPEQYNSPATLDLLHERLEQVMEMEQRLVEKEESIQLNPTYIHKLLGPVEEDLAPQPIAASSTM